MKANPYLNKLDVTVARYPKGLIQYKDLRFQVANRVETKFPKLSRNWDAQKSSMVGQRTMSNLRDIRGPTS